MKHLWYKIVRFYVYLGLHAYFKEIQAVHLEPIAKNKAYLFVANHRNGLIDPILVAITQQDTIFHFLTRASAFKSPIADFLLRSINMLPIYRIRDGKDSIQKNQQIFDACHAIFNQNESVLMFPEGNHGHLRRVRGLKNGFARIAFEYLDKNPDKELHIIPVGLNYTNFLEKGSSVSVYYGRAILVNEYHQINEIKEAINALKNSVRSQLKELTTHIESIEKHREIEKKLIDNGIDFLNPIETNKSINQVTIETGQKHNSTTKQKNIFISFIGFLFKINTIFPIQIWKSIKANIKDPVLIPTFRFGISIALIPLFYLLQATIIGIFSNTYYALGYFIISIIIVWFYKNNQEIESVTTLPS